MAEHLDFQGNELMVGDKVSYLKKGSSSSYLKTGTVESFTDQYVYIGNSGKRVSKSGVILDRSKTKRFNEPKSEYSYIVKADGYLGDLTVDIKGFELRKTKSYFELQMETLKAYWLFLGVGEPINEFRNKKYFVFMADVEWQISWEDFEDMFSVEAITDEEALQIEKSFGTSSGFDIFDQVWESFTDQLIGDGSIKRVGEVAYELSKLISEYEDSK